MNIKNICGISPNEIGMCNGIQSWNDTTPPKGYAFIPDEFVEIFQSTTPGGFVNITVENNTVTSMTVNTEAYNAYLASLPEPEPEPDREPTADEILNALLGVTE